jgi:glycerol uptake facilitator-like aquaporin
MDRTLFRAYLVEAVGTFALVFFGAGAVCVNAMTAVSSGPPGLVVLRVEQPGLVGLALAQGLILAVMLAVTVPVSGGWLNPAATVVLWLAQRLDTGRAAWLLGAQLVGAALAGLCLSRLFDPHVLEAAHLGTPHLNFLAYRGVNASSIASGTALELVLTFFLVLAMFALGLEKADGQRGGLAAGLTLTAGTLAAYPLTGAAANPARWFGTVVWELALLRPPANEPGPLTDAFVYIAGPLFGGLMAGLLYFRVLLPARPKPPEAHSPPPRARK